MSTDPQVERCLSSIRELSDALVRDLLALPPAAWDGPTNCAPWRVRDLAAHIASSGRLDLHTAAQAGSVRLDGDVALSERFSRIFPRP